MVEAQDGRWLGVEVKLGQLYVDDAAAHALALREKLGESVGVLCGALLVVTPQPPTCVRDDRVIVTSVASLVS